MFGAAITRALLSGDHACVVPKTAANAGSLGTSRCSSTSVGVDAAASSAALAASSARSSAAARRCARRRGAMRAIRTDVIFVI